MSKLKISLHILFILISWFPQFFLLITLREHCLQLPNSVCFFEILASTYGPRPAAPVPYGPGSAAPGPHGCGLGTYGSGSLMIWKNILSHIRSRSITWMYTATGSCSKYAPGAACIQIMLLEHIWLRISFKIINGLEDHMILDQLVPDHKSRPKSQKSTLYTPGSLFQLLWSVMIWKLTLFD